MPAQVHWSAELKRWRMELECQAARLDALSLCVHSERRARHFRAEAARVRAVLRAQFGG